MLGGMLSLVRDHARSRRRDAGIARRPPRLHSGIQNFLFTPLHCFFPARPVQARPEILLAGWLECELQLQVDPPVSRRRRIRLPRKRICFAKKWRAQVSNGGPEVHIVKQVPRVHAERQIVSVVRRTSSAEHPSASVASTASAVRSRTMTGSAEGWTAAASASRAPGCRFFLLSKSKRLAQPQIKCEASRPRRIVDGNDSLPRLRKRIEATECSLNHARLPCGTARAKRGARIELRIAKDILASRNVEWDPRANNHKRAQAEAVRRSNRAAEENAMSNVERGPTVIRADVPWNGRYVPCSASVAVRITQRVVAEEGKIFYEAAPGWQAHAAVHDQLILLEDAPGSVLIDDVIGIEPRRQRRIRSVCRKHIGIELVDAARIQICHRQVRELR